MVSWFERDALLNFVEFQFVMYGIGGTLGFIGWILSLVFPLSAPGYLGYITGHLERWTINFMPWGVIILIAGLLGFVTAIFLSKHDILALILGILAFAIGFTANMIVARNPPAHLFVGVMVGWLILAPLIFYVICRRSESFLRVSELN